MALQGVSNYKKCPKMDKQLVTYSSLAKSVSYNESTIDAITLSM
jgi:hypothetical protein